MNEKEKQLAETLLPCPHCGKSPSVELVTYEDERSKWVDVSFVRQMWLGKTYCRIECCAVMEGIDLEEVRETWNRRPESRQAKLKEGMNILRAKLAARKAVDKIRPRQSMPQPRYDDVYFAGLDWLNGEPLPDQTILLSIKSEIEELKELIAGTPKEQVIDRKSLEARLHKVAEEGWELLRQWSELHLKEFPEYAEMGREFNEVRKKVRRELKRGLRRCESVK